MVEESTAARPYARAVFELAQAQGQAQQGQRQNIRAKRGQIKKDPAQDTPVQDIPVQDIYEHWSEMLKFMAACAYDPLMRAVLDSPRLTSEQAAELFISVGEGRLDQQADNFIRVLAENRRLILLPEIAALYEYYRQEAQGTIEAEVIAARKLKAEQLKTIIRVLKARLNREVSLTARIDKNLLGGVIIRAGDLVIDGSIRGRLDQLATALTR